MRSARVIAGLSITTFVILAAACTGPDGPTGPVGPAGVQGNQGNVGPSGKDGTAGLQGPKGDPGDPGNDADGGTSNPAGCLSPCHGFGGIVDQWKSSAHYAAYVVNIGTAEADSWTAPGSACGNCHAEDGIEQRVKANVGTTNSGVVTNLASGEVNFKDPVTNKVVESTYAGEASVAVVSCVTCHDITDANDPHKTGNAYVPGAFPQRVPTGKTDPSFIEKSPGVATVDGMPAGNLGLANTCVWCHKSRKDVTAYITASNNLSSTFWGPHEGPQADLFSSSGAYQYTGKTYGTSTHQIKLTCIDCHMPAVAGNDNVGDHSFEPRVAACQQCHVGTTSFDVNGGQSLIKAAMFELQAVLNNAGYLTRSAAAPYAALQPAELADGKFALDLTRPGGPSLTADLAGAVYNYILVARGGAMGAHNPKYIQQLVFDSYFAVTGLPPASIIRPK